MADEKNLEGQSFRSEALTGSGTITEDGTYAEPLPDPTEVRGLGGRRTSGGRLVPEPASAEYNEKVNETKSTAAKSTSRTAK